MNRKKQPGSPTELSELIDMLKPGCLMWVFSSVVDQAAFNQIQRACERGGMDPFYIFWPRAQVQCNGPLASFPLGQKEIKRIAKLSNTVVISIAPISGRKEGRLTLSDIRQQWGGMMHECDAEIIILIEKGSNSIVRNLYGTWGPLVMDS